MKKIIKLISISLLTSVGSFSTALAECEMAERCSYEFHQEMKRKLMECQNPDECRPEVKKAIKSGWEFRSIYDVMAESRVQGEVIEAELILYSIFGSN